MRSKVTGINLPSASSEQNETKTMSPRRLSCTAIPAFIFIATTLSGANGCTGELIIHSFVVYDVVIIVLNS